MLHVIVPSYSCRDILPRCITSIQRQSVDFRCTVVDDASYDGSGGVVRKYIADDPRFELLRLADRGNGMRTQALGIAMAMPEPDDIIATVDGDDWLVGRDALAATVRTFEETDALVVHGSILLSNGKEWPNQPYSDAERATASYRQATWRAHAMRAFRYSLWQQLDMPAAFLWNGEWVPSAYDLALMFPLMEMSGGRVAMTPGHHYRIGSPSRTDLALQQAWAARIRVRPPWQPPQPTPDRELCVIITAYNCDTVIAQCIRGLQRQAYPFRAIFVDDASTDRTRSVVATMTANDSRFSKLYLRDNAGPMRSRLLGITAIAPSPNAVIVLLDGDDFLTRDDALSVVAAAYRDSGALVTIGQMTMAGKLHGCDYPADVRAAGAYRQYPWVCRPIRSFAYSLWHKFSHRDSFKYGGQWYRDAADQAIMLPLMELAGPRVVFIPGSYYEVGLSTRSHQARGVMEAKLIRAKPKLAPLV